MFTTEQLEKFYCKTVAEERLVKSHKEALRRIAELEQALLGQSVRIATCTDI